MALPRKIRHIRLHFLTVPKEEPTLFRRCPGPLTVRGLSGFVGMARVSGVLEFAATQDDEVRKCGCVKDPVPYFGGCVGDVAAVSTRDSMAGGRPRRDRCGHQYASLCSTRGSWW